MTENVDSLDEVRTLEGDLQEEVALNANGEFFDGNDPGTWQDAEEAPIETISRGPVRFRIVDPDATELALATGFIEPDCPPVLCLRVAFEQADGAPQPIMGQVITLLVEDGVYLVFAVVVTWDDLHGPDVPDLVPGAVFNEDYAVIQPGEGLLVQIVDDEADAREAA